MQGRPEPGSGPWDRAEPNSSLNGTSKHRAVPQRPPGMTRLNTPPPMPRVPRPQRQPSPPTNMRRRLLIIGSTIVIGALLACAIGYISINLLTGLTVSNGAANTANDFLTALSQGHYDQAYTNLGPAITIHTSSQQFAQQAQSIDTCYGKITDYPEVSGSATNQGSTQSYAYTISRGKLSKPYQLRLTLQQSVDEGNNWRITDYGSSLGPGQPAPPCSK